MTASHSSLGTVLPLGPTLWLFFQMVLKDGTLGIAGEEWINRVPFTPSSPFLPLAFIVDEVLWCFSVSSHGLCLAWYPGLVDSP